MSDDTTRKVLFGVWLTWTVAMALIFADGCIDGSPDIDKLILALCGVVICQLYWQLWHEKAAELHIEIFKLPDGREIRKEHWE